MTKKYIPVERDLVCYCPECGIPMDGFTILEGAHKGTHFYNCPNHLDCGVRHIEKGVAESYQERINNLAIKFDALTYGTHPISS